MGLTPTDREALKLAIEVCRRESPGRAQQIDSKLAPGPEREAWREVAEFCSTVCQERSLDVRPWQVVPANFDPSDLQADPHRGGKAALELLERMQRCGVSKFHPDPVSECDRVEAERKAAS